MALVDPNDFLKVLAAHMAQQASIAFNVSPRIIWIDRADDANAADPCSVLRIYDGRRPYLTPLQELAIQCVTTGTQSPVARAQAWELFNALHGADGRPLRMTQIGTDPVYRLNGVVEARSPAYIGLDEKNRAQVVFNFSVMVVAL